jgi:hypothetical protein
MGATGMDTPETILQAVRDLVEAAEAAGWDGTDNDDVLNRGRDAYAALRDFFEIDLPGDEPRP